MTFEKGNQYYLLRKFDGRFFEYDDPMEFLKKCLEYFKKVDENPIITQDFKGKDATYCEYKHQRPYTKEGICVYLQIALNTWENYKKRDDFLNIITYIEQIIRNQKFEGAASGIFNSNIIARELGLTDKKEHEHKGNLSVTGFNYIAPEDEAND